jgi:hypothetical protein
MLKIVLLYLFLNQSGTLLGVYMNWNFFFFSVCQMYFRWDRISVALPLRHIKVMKFQLRNTISSNDSRAHF